MISTLHSTSHHHSYPHHPTIFDHIASPSEQINTYPHPHLLRSHNTSRSVARIQTSGLDSVRGLPTPYSIRSNSFSSSSVGKHGIRPMMKTPTKAARNSFPYNTVSDGGKSDKESRHKHGGRTGAPVRRRISRACDQCNQLRTKCDGRSPCAHCTEFNLACEYFRERKKRGKASRKDIAQQQAAAAAAGSSRGEESPVSPVYSDTGSSFHHIKDDGASPIGNAPRPGIPGRSVSVVSDGAILPVSGPRHLGSGQIQGDMSGIQDGRLDQNMDQSGQAMVNGYEYVQDMTQQPMATMSLQGQAMITPMAQPLGTPGSYIGYGDTSFTMMNNGDHTTDTYPFPRDVGSPITNFMAQSPSSGSGGWLPMPSPSSTSFPLGPMGLQQNTLRYPVLKPIIATIKKIIPESLACDLLDFYFASSSAAHHHPQSPMLLAVIFRKKSFLHPTNPRQCSSALLASMLWVAAQNCDAPFLTSPPSARSRICSKLLDITINHLKPLIHGANDISPITAMNSAVHGVTLSGLGVAASDDPVPEDSGLNATLDDIATYCHLATVVSASEYKAASLRWWTAAWSLARELKLGRELPPNPDPTPRASPGQEEINEELDINIGHPENNHSGSESPRIGVYSEEEREERRRIWWLLYTVDRHLSLCYNKPLFFLDSECSDLLQPVPERKWQSGEYYSGDQFSFPETPRRRGPTFEATSHSIYGYFTPLMTILGEIVELNQARNHPRFGINFRGAGDWDQQVKEIRQHLRIYEDSLKEFERQSLDPEIRQEVGTPSARSIASNGSRVNESFLQTKTVVAYGTHVLHVLHNLLHGKWDPISLLDDSDLWISSSSFPEAMRHAVSGAEAIAAILDYDPDLSYMPFFFGIYLLQGSFLLLLIADKLQAGANPNVVNACETVVRAVEACVVTLNTEYQRNFRKVMRSVLAQVKGRFPDDYGEQEQRRREVLSLYRWTPDGTGLAL